jgi:hypothetical protein
MSIGVFVEEEDDRPLVQIRYGAATRHGVIFPFVWSGHSCTLPLTLIFDSGRPEASSRSLRKLGSLRC